MSGLLAVVGAADNVQQDEVARLLATMAHRGAEESGGWRSPQALVAVARDRWEMQPGFAGPTLVASRGPLHVVCDATLYYRADLISSLSAAGIQASSDSAADLIAAAYAAFGIGCVDRLEGDYAFCVWDEAAKTLFCARDPFGTRGLFHTELDGDFLVASTPHPLVGRQGVRAGFDQAGVVRAILMRHGAGTETAWNGVRELPAGHFLVSDRAGVRVSRFWEARGAKRWSTLSSDDAIKVFSRILADAATERGAVAGVAVGMSGGQDSTGIVASLDPAVRASTRILSFKFPEGDPGNEDWYVQQVADAFRLPLDWVDTAGVGLFEGAEDRARFRSNCHGHLFEGLNRLIARTANRLGSRVLLSGHGGDNVCAVGNWPMADFLRRGQLLSLRRFMAARGYRGPRALVDYVVRPALPFWVFDAMEPILGRRISSRPYERPIPEWVAPPPPMLDAIVDEDRTEFARSIQRGRPAVTAQRRAWGLMDVSFTRACAGLFDLTRHEGVELRMPFYDRRLVEFVMSRPADEFNQPRQNKVILRRAMQGRLPDRSRDPQAGGFKSGTALGIMQTRYAPEVAAAITSLSDEPWISESIGAVDRRRFEGLMSDASALRWQSAADVSLTLFVEFWLRGNAVGDV